MNRSMRALSGSLSLAITRERKHFYLFNTYIWTWSKYGPILIDNKGYLNNIYFLNPVVYINWLCLFFNILLLYGLMGYTDYTEYIFVLVL